MILLTILTAVLIPFLAVRVHHMETKTLKWHLMGLPTLSILILVVQVPA